jgi:hypothetical protein
MARAQVMIDGLYVEVFTACDGTAVRELDYVYLLDSRPERRHDRDRVWLPPPGLTVGEVARLVAESYLARKRDPNWGGPLP